MNETNNHGPTGRRFQKGNDGHTAGQPSFPFLQITRE
jgi:hypothetical protein